MQAPNDANKNILPQDPVEDQNDNADDDNVDNNVPDIDPTPMRQAFMHLGLAPIAVQEFINNGILTPADLCVMNGKFIYIEAILYWTNHQHITGRPYEAQDITRNLAMLWIE